jgi:hypothetical protein
MRDRTQDRDALLSDLRADKAADFADYRERILGHESGCPSFADMIRYAKREADESTRNRLDEHFRGCTHCASWFSGFERGFTNQPERQDHPLPPPGLTPAQAASAKKVSQATVRAAIESGELPVVRDGESDFIPLEGLVEWVPKPPAQSPP